MSDAGCYTFYKQTIPPIKGLGDYSKFDKYDIIERVKDLMGSGWGIDLGTAKIKLSYPSMAWNTPWWHNKTSINKECGLWTIMFNHWGFIPRGCQECWKVVVRPRTLKELFALQEVEKKLDRPSKCGIEVRSYTAGHYGGYFYNNSLDEGRECYKTVREAVSDAISQDVKVILKRACTEMELGIGPSVFWKLTKENLELEDYISTRMDIGKSSLTQGQPDYVLNHLYKRWILWAHSHADWTYLEYTNGLPLYAPPVMYHEGDLETIKKDFMAARMTQAGIPQEKVCDIRDKLLNTAIECGLTPCQAGTALGYTDINPLFVGEEDQMTNVKEVAA